MDKVVFCRVRETIGRSAVLVALPKAKEDTQEAVRKLAEFKKDVRWAGETLQSEFQIYEQSSQQLQEQLKPYHGVLSRLYDQLIVTKMRIEA
ncbi:hypothetical protein OCU04_010252 [Sclerotinia nivalis]|uniref:Uncharacterized protein n=1 Tax=Sclerotinia nivalis TaxID=352851 RepID=A0A9X0AF06_9HELO|nr:hypothetical protein OCU04_010252 [Sclerotinia nivalis]